MTPEHFKGGDNYRLSLAFDLLRTRADWQECSPDGGEVERADFSAARTPVPAPAPPLLKHYSGLCTIRALSTDRL